MRLSRNVNLLGRCPRVDASAPCDHFLHVFSTYPYKGDSGMRRWVGLGVIGDNLVTIGAALAKTPNR